MFIGLFGVILMIHYTMVKISLFRLTEVSKCILTIIYFDIYFINLPVSLLVFLCNIYQYYILIRPPSINWLIYANLILSMASFCNPQ